MANDKEQILNNKFIYRDKFSRNGWLNMMNERLLMAKKLLREDGVIFVSIDDSEQAYLKVLMDEIFGEENFVTNFIWQKKSGGGAAAYIYEGHEYIICYGKNKKLIKNKLGVLKEVNKKNLNKDSKGIYYLELDKIRKEYGKHLEKSLHRNCFYEELEIYKNEEQIKKIEEKLKNKEYELVYSDKHKMHFIAEKKYLVLDKYIWVNPYSVINNVWTADGNNEIEKIFGKSAFNNPKPIELLKKLFFMTKKREARILDFFAGSGTTAQAVMELNREDGGNRTYTIVTNNENNIAYDVTYERLYRINKGIGTKGETFKWTEKNEPFKNNLNVYKTEYYDTEIDENGDSLINQKLKQNLKEEMNNFGINNFNNDSKEILTKLLSLKPIGKD
ncbi:DNA methyltransferase [Mycoplasmopsis lipofaciens]|uniref:DNA methyltransferase n=1 Tax=Mycoplasmopsis lipofaciens TaxID=114884 RepID=UPI000AD41A99|nr:site-specific DNA-methyltransferase [Mycoplasmopsis lipofaciens]